MLHHVSRKDFLLCWSFSRFSRESQLCERAFELIINGSALLLHTSAMFFLLFEESFLCFKRRKKLTLEATDSFMHPTWIHKSYDVKWSINSSSFMTLENAYKLTEARNAIYISVSVRWYLFWPTLKLPKLEWEQLVFSSITWKCFCVIKCNIVQTIYWQN